MSAKKKKKKKRYSQKNVFSSYYGAYQGRGESEHWSTDCPPFLVSLFSHFNFIFKPLGSLQGRKKDCWGMLCFFLPSDKEIHIFLSEVHAIERNE